jgi:hypothetical protein
LIETGLDPLDLACVALDVQRRGADPGIGVFLQSLHLAAETFVDQEPSPTWADGVQRLDPDTRIGRPEPGKHRAGIGYRAAAPA